MAKLADCNCCDVGRFPPGSAAIDGSIFVAREGHKVEVGSTVLDGVVKQNAIAARPRCDLGTCERTTDASQWSLWTEVTYTVEPNQPCKNPVSSDFVAALHAGGIEIGG
jgi:hypothetical protein